MASWFNDSIPSFIPQDQGGLFFSSKMYYVVAQVSILYCVFVWILDLLEILWFFYTSFLGLTFNMDVVDLSHNQELGRILSQLPALGKKNALEK